MQIKQIRYGNCKNEQSIDIKEITDSNGNGNSKTRCPTKIIVFLLTI